MMNETSRYKAYSIGRFTYGDPLIKRWSKAETISIGSFCSFACNVTILLGGNHRTDWVTTYPFSKIIPDVNIEGHPSTKGTVVIGNDVWIGTGALILSGVTIGDGAVIAARSVVATNVEPYSIVAGNPAKEIKKRFSQKNIDDLMKIKWWNWEIGKIKENMPLLLSNKIDEFITKNQ
jgi:virginiamycin A acetyltransferase